MISSVEQWYSKGRPSEGPRASRALFPGSFDPLTNGHVDIAARALEIFDEVVIAVVENPEKETLFSLTERVEMIREVFRGYNSRLQVECFSGLLVDFAKKLQTNVLIRGLRAVSDYEYEVQMALMNRSLSSEVETIFLVTSEQNSFISSHVVKQVAALGGNVSGLVPTYVERVLRERFAVVDTS